MLQWWSEFCSNFSTDPKAFDSIIWNNCNLQIDCKPTCYHNYMNAGIIFISNLMYSRNNVESFNIGKDKVKFIYQIAAKISKSLSFCLSKMWSRDNIKLKNL